MKTLLKENISIIILTLCAILAITTQSCTSNKAELKDLGISASKIDVAPDTLSFILSGSFTPDYTNYENIEPFLIKIYVYAIDGIRKQRKVIYVNKDDFKLVDGKMYLPKKLYNFPKKVTIDEKQKYKLDIDVEAKLIKKS